MAAALPTYSLRRDSPESQALLKELQAELLRIFGNEGEAEDDSLAKYVVVLVSGNRTREEITSEIQGLLREIMDDHEAVSSELCAWCVSGYGLGCMQRHGL